MAPGNGKILWLWLAPAGTFGWMKSARRQRTAFNRQPSKANR